MTETDNSWSQKVDSWLKQTHHDEMVGRQAGLFSQPSVLSTHYLFLIDTLHPFTYYPFIKFSLSDRKQMGKSKYF
jgi:hypothetical protein